MTLKGRTALVTGAARRVGRVIALALAGRGANVAIHYRSSQAEAEATARDAAALGVQAMTVRAELTDEREVARMVGEVGDRFGRLDVLVNNASVFQKTPLETVTGAQWDAMLDANLKAPFFCSVHASRRMLVGPDGGGGAIVNIADWAALRPYTNYLPYCIAKAGLVAMTQGMARTLAPKIRVNAIGPGPVLVPADLPADEAAEIMEKTPMKRHGSPEDVAAAVIFLLEGSDFVTGVFLPVDGGRLIA